MGRGGGMALAVVPALLAGAWLQPAAAGPVVCTTTLEAPLAGSGSAGMNASGPVEVTVRSQTRRPKGVYNAPEGFHIDYRYANGVRMTMKAETDRAKWGIKFTGTEGWLFSEGRRLQTHPAALKDQPLKDSDTRLYASDDHYRNFIDCVYSRKPTAATAETGHRSASACYLGAIAAETGGTLQFDPKKETFPNHPRANRHLMKPMRAPWKLT